MPQVEINSPLCHTQVQQGFTVSGWTDQPNQDVLCTVSGTGGSQTLTPTSDADGNWETAATTVPIADDYTVSASITVDTDTFSDVNEGVDVHSGINTGANPIPINIGTLLVTARTATSNRTLTISGKYSSPNPAFILVQVVVMRRRKFKVFSAGIIDNPTSGTWTIDLLAPPAKPERRVAVYAVRVRGTTTTSGQTTKRV
jgi:hypothetical protein